MFGGNVLLLLFWLSTCEHDGSRDFARVGDVKIWNLRCFSTSHCSLLIIIVPNFSLITLRNKKSLQTWAKATKDVKFHVPYTTEVTAAEYMRHHRKLEIDLRVAAVKST